MIPGLSIGWILVIVGTGIGAVIQALLSGRYSTKSADINKQAELEAAEKESEDNFQNNILNEVNSLRNIVLGLSRDLDDWKHKYYKLLEEYSIAVQNQEVLKVKIEILEEDIRTWKIRYDSLNKQYKEVVDKADASTQTASQQIINLTRRVDELSNSQ